MVRAQVQAEPTKAGDIPASEMTDDDIHWLFRRLRWPPDGAPICPNCGSDKSYYMPQYRRWKCRDWRTCPRQFTVLAGTLFDGGKMQLRSYLAACEAFCAPRPASIRGPGGLISRAAGMNPKAATLLAMKLRSLVADGETVSVVELLRRALHAKPMPEVWNRYR